ncbi:hypothetical protein IQ06DRAFT_100329 [Phaeosphaeriaceae sp. SRC1lsM3a]|nr:hypothetical protein IQ06DRAFT_100329 [Stagonospora sp. SRC1lsM3a]
MDRLTTLPDELLIDIVERVHAVSILTALGLTCKKLQRLCRPFVWKGVVLPWRLNKSAPIAKFIKVHAGNNDIRSLRLCPQRALLNAFRIKMKSSHDHVDALCLCLSSLPSLATFSINLDGQIDRRCALPGPVLARIVRALPPSLRNLELDTECTDEIWDEMFASRRQTVTISPSSDGSTLIRDEGDYPIGDSTEHLCHAISEHIPRLETLYLRLSCICTELFRSLSTDQTSTQPQPSSTLRRALITFDVGNERERRNELHVESRDCLSPPTGSGYSSSPLTGSRFSSAGATTLPKQKIFSHLLELQAAGAFPELQRFIVFSWHTDARIPTSSLTVRDIATRSVKRFPTMRPERTGDWTVGELADFDDESSYLVRNDEAKDFLGDQKRLQKAVLHEVSWLEEEKGGVRTPPAGGMLRDEIVELCGEHLVDVDEIKDIADLEKAFPNRGGFARARVVVDQL